jgi:Putative zinc- or iron-chelating domain
MVEGSRQQRRKEVREQTKLGTKLLGAGLASEPKKADVLAVARVVAATFADRADPRRASAAAALAHDLCDASLRTRPSNAAIACRAGCSYCCHQFVGAVAPEVFLVADAIRASRDPSLASAAVIARCAPLIGLSPQDRVGRKLPCPVLVEGRCGAYTARPLVCRQTTSLDLQGCLEEFEGHNMNEQIEVSSAHLAHAGTAHVVLLGAIRAAKLADAAYELSAALDIALRDPGSQRGWLAGEPVFASLGTPIPVPPRVDFVARQIATELA